MTGNEHESREEQRPVSLGEATNTITDPQPDTEKMDGGSGSHNSGGTPIGDKSDIRYPPVMVRSIIMVGLLLSMFLIALDLSIIATAVPTITAEFQSTSDVGWYGAAYFMTLSTFQSLWGKAYKFFSLRLVFLVSLFVFMVGSLVCALAPNNIAFICGRAVQGVGGAGLSGGCYIIIAFISPPEHIAALFGILGSVFSISSVVGPLLGGAFSQSVTWRWCFYINLPLGGVAAACITFFFRTPDYAQELASTARSALDSRAIAKAFDPLGIILSLSGLICFVMALEWGGISHAWNSSTIIGLLVGWILLTVAFYLVEWMQKDQALLVLRILARRDIAVVSAFIFCLNAANFALIYNLPTYFQAIEGVSPLESGIRNIPTILSSALFTLVASTLVGKLGLYQPFLIVAGVLATVGGGLIYTFDLHTGIGPIIGYQIIYGAGVGVGIQIPLVVAQAISSGEDQALATTGVLYHQFLGGAYGLACTDCVLNNLLIQSLAKYEPDLNAAKVIAAGSSSSLSSLYHGNTLAGIRRAYLDGLRGSWAMGIAFFGLTVLIALMSKPRARMRAKGTKPGEDEGTSMPVMG